MISQQNCDKTIINVFLLLAIALNTWCPCEVVLSCHIKTWAMIIILLNLYVVYINFVRTN